MSKTMLEVTYNEEIYIYKINKLKVLYVYTFKKYLNTWYFFNLFP